MALSADDIQQRFGKHAAAIEGPNPNEAVHARLREAYVQFSEMLNVFLPDGRDTSLAFTSLEETSMWSHKAVAKETFEVVDLGSTDPPTFEQELVKLINKHGLEKGSNTADWILCEVLRQMLIAFDLAFEANDGDDEYAVLDFAKRAVRALDVGVRLRERQGAPTADIRQVLDEPAEPKDEVSPVRSHTSERVVPLVDRTGETPSVVGHATVVEKADGYHIEGIVSDLPETLKPVALSYHTGSVLKDQDARIFRPANTTPDKVAYEDALIKQQPATEKPPADWKTVEDIPDRVINGLTGN